MLEKLIKRIPFKKTVIAGALLFGLGSCGDTINNYYLSPDVKSETKVEETYSADVQTEVKEEPCLDFDNDGICNDVDFCPLETEDFDGFEDDDGCPESDLKTKDSYEVGEDTFEIKEDLGNQCPYFDPVLENVEVNEKTELEINFNAVDPDGDNVTYKLFFQDDEEWEDISEGKNFDITTGKMMAEIDCSGSGEHQFKIVASDGKCEVEEEFTLKVNDICDCSDDGHIKTIGCETDSPCQGHQTQECVDGFWENVSECEDVKLISNHAGLSSVSENHVASLKTSGDANAYLESIYIHNINTNSVENILEFENIDEDHLTHLFLNLSEDKVMLSTGYQENGNDPTPVNKLFDINNGTSVDINPFDLSFCTDLDSNYVLCTDGDGTLSITSISDLKHTYIDNFYEFSAGDHEKLTNLQIEDNKISYADEDGQIRIYDIVEQAWLALPLLEGYYPLISVDKVIYSPLPEFAENNNSLFLYDTSTGKLENLTEEMGGFSCLTTNRFYAAFQNETLVCLSEINGEDNSYVVNTHTKEYEQLPLIKGEDFTGYVGGMEGLHNNKVILRADDELTDQPDMYLCELKGQWGEFWEEEEVAEEEVVEEAVEEE